MISIIEAHAKEKHTWLNLVNTPVKYSLLTLNNVPTVPIRDTVLVFHNTSKDIASTFSMHTTLQPILHFTMFKGPEN